MKRNYQVNNFNHQELSKRIAYHEAGHATAIYLYNKQQNLPPIFFQIILKSEAELTRDMLSPIRTNVAAKVEGGCLVNDLFASFSSQSTMTASEKYAYYQALDADMINLLAGAVAEANYLYKRDDELLTAQLLSIKALRNYGSESDLSRIDEYLSYLTDCPQHKARKLSELLIQTFAFMTHPQNWKAVNAVAQFILSSKKQVIRCEEIFTVVDSVTMAM